MKLARRWVVAILAAYVSLHAQKASDPEDGFEPYDFFDSHHLLPGTHIAASRAAFEPTISLGVGGVIGAVKKKFNIGKEKR